MGILLRLGDIVLLYEKDKSYIIFLVKTVVLQFYIWLVHARGLVPAQDLQFSLILRY